MILKEIIEFNPTRPITKGKIAPFIEMAALPQDSKDISYTFLKEFNGSGTKFKNGDTLLARITPCLENGKTAKVNCLEENEIAHGSTEFIVMKAKEPEYDEDFVYYLCRWPKFREYAVARMEGSSGRQRVDWRAIAEFEYDLPNKEERKRIGHCLKQFDDKIANNNRINQTLEAMAQALFKSWFVDFDPVKAKIEAIANDENPQLAAMQVISGKTTEELQQMSADKLLELQHTADLFPDEMEESELGWIPKGWKVESLKNVLQIKHGYAFKGEYITTNETDKILLTPGNFKVGGGFKGDKYKFFLSDDFPKEYVLNKGDLIVTMTDLSKAGDTLGYPAFVPENINKLLLHNQRLGKVIEEKIKKTFIFQLMCQDTYREKILGSATGSTVKHTSPSRIYEHKFVLPSSSLVDRFDLIGNNQILFQMKLVEESKQLSVIRDTLLPKLLLGELEFEPD